MNISHVISTMQFGGAQNIALGLAEEAVHSGHNASIISVCKGNDYCSRLNNYNVTCCSLEYTGNFRPYNIIQITKLRSRLIRYIKMVQPDLIHVHLFIPKILLYGMSGVSGIPVIQTQHDNSPWWFKRNMNSRLKTHIEKKMAKITARYTVAISESVKHDMVKYLRLNENKIRVINNFIDTSFIGKENPGKKNPAGKLYMITRLDIEKKGLDTALSIIKAVKEKMPDSTLTLIGDGPGKHRLSSMIQESGLENIVHINGYTENVSGNLSDADIVLMPSRWEGFGLTAAEAAAMGVPVVASRVGGLQDVVIDGKTGFTCEPEDVNAFAECIVTLLKDKKLYTSISKQAKELALKRFDRKKAFLQYETLYRKILNG